MIGNYKLQNVSISGTIVAQQKEETRCFENL
jgi:hypothetical protein